MAGFALAALAASAGLSILGGMAQAKSERAVAEFNAMQAERDAAAAEAEAKEEARRIRRQGRRLRGEQISQAAASGVTLSGSVLDILADDAMEIELQALDRLRQGEIASIQGRERADITRYAGEQRANQSILSGLSRAAVLGFQASQAGLFDGDDDKGGKTTGVGATRLPPKPIPNPRR